MVFANILIFAFGLVLLIKCSDFFVKSSSLIAKKMGVSEFVIGLTVVALGTSIPELASSVFASLKNESGIVIGNVVGSNIANICLIIGITAAIAAIHTKKQMIERDGYIMLFASFVFLLAIMNGVIGIVESAVFVLLYVSYVLYLMEERPGEEKEYHFREFLRYFYRFRYLITIKSRIMKGINGRKNRKDEITSDEKKKIKELFMESIYKDLLVIIICGVGIVLGAKFAVDNAVLFANMLGIPSTLIAITLIAIGTSLPELFVSITAARKGFGNIAVGNVIGSNITNIFLVVGVSGLISPLYIIKSTLYFSVPFMIVMSILLLVFIRSYWQIRRYEGIVFLCLYVLFLLLLFSGLVG